MHNKKYLGMFLFHFVGFLDKAKEMAGNTGMLCGWQSPRYQNKI